MSKYSGVVTRRVFSLLFNQFILFPIFFKRKRVMRRGTLLLEGGDGVMGWVSKGVNHIW